MRHATLLAAVLLVLWIPLAAEDLRIELDPELTSIDFRLQATLHSVHGSAAPVSGQFFLNTESGNMDGELRIDATTADTGNKKRDRKMHKSVLLSGEHPEIVLRVQRIEGGLLVEGQSEVVLHGQVEILGLPHAVAIPLDIRIDGDRFVASAEFEVPYVDWGLDDPSTFVLRVAKVVEVRVAAEGSVHEADSP